MSSPFTSINEAIQLLKAGDVVALPSETVYGLAADIQSEEALRKVFSVKNRPFFDPLIVHVASLDQAQNLCSEWNAVLDSLAKAFWPGPLTLVVPKNSKVSSLITSGLGTVALRSPHHSLFLQAIQKVGPLAAPSANRFGKTSPTKAEHVLQEFSGQVAVVDGGVCEVGVESTVVEVQKIGQTWKLEILRPGGITKEQLESHLNGAGFSFEMTRRSKQNSPGHLENHYQPDIPLILISLSNSSRADLPSHLKTHFPQFESFGELKLHQDPSLAAREIYAKLRQLSQGSFQALYIVNEAYMEKGLWEAIQDRLQKAASFKLRISPENT